MNRPRVILVAVALVLCSRGGWAGIGFCILLFGALGWAFPAPREILRDDVRRSDEWEDILDTPAIRGRSVDPTAPSPEDVAAMRTNAGRRP